METEKEEFGNGKNQIKPDDKFSIVCGDLGLGEGLKPGGMLHGVQSLNLDLDLGDTGNDTELAKNKNALFKVCDSCYANGGKVVSKNSQTLVRKRSKEKRLSTDSIGPDDLERENFPTYADIPLGTSLRQQKKLFQHNLGSLRKKHESLSCDDTQVDNSGDNNRKRLTSTEIEKKMLEALQEVEELKIELDTCKKRLESKYMAIAILKKQADETTEEHGMTETIAKECSKILAEEVNKLQFELEWRESSFMDSQQTWAVRFDRVCQENALLMSTLEARSEELRRANSHKMALARERDELLALLDVREKLKYERTRSTSAEDDYGMYTSTELAVLGACHCRATNPQPCGCAHAAANMRRDIVRLREEIELYKHRRDEAFLTVDAYRLAFEEQLNKTKALTLRMSELTVPPSSKTVKAKAALKWLISVLNDEDLSMPISNNHSPGHPNGPLTGVNTSVMSPQEIITLLTEMVHEKNEALAHQKLAAQVLANKLDSLERKLKSMREEDVFT